MPQSIAAILAVWFAVACGLAAAEPYSFAKGEYESARDTTLLVLGGDPKEAFVLGIGRSPSVILEIVNRLPGGVARQLPLSGFRFQPTEVPDAGLPSLTPEEEIALFAHFDRFVPSRTELGQRALVIVDYCKHGHSLIGLSLCMKKYLKSRDREDTQVEVVGITERSVRDKLVSLANDAKVSMKVISVNKKDAFGGRLIEAEYDPYALYGASYLGAEGIAEQSEDNRAMAQGIAAKMASDTSLNADWSLRLAKLKREAAAKGNAVVHTMTMIPARAGKNTRQTFDSIVRTCKGGLNKLSGAKAKP